jgi:hypothetical protein
MLVQLQHLPSRARCRLLSQSLSHWQRFAPASCSEIARRHATLEMSNRGSTNPMFCSFFFPWVINWFFCNFLRCGVVPMTLVPSDYKYICVGICCPGQSVRWYSSPQSEFLRHCFCVLKCSISSMPSTYLGLPLSTNKIT